LEDGEEDNSKKRYGKVLAEPKDIQILWFDRQQNAPIVENH